MKKIIILVFVFLIKLGIVFSIKSTFESEGSYTTQLTEGEYECYYLEWTAASAPTNMTLDLADQITPQSGRVLVWDNLTGEVMANATLSSGNVANFNVPTANQVEGRAFVAAFMTYANSPAWTRVWKNPDAYPTTNNGLRVLGSSQPYPFTNLSKERCQQAGVTNLNQHGLIFVEWNNRTAALDTTPPNIIYYNLTNENGCENWNTDKSNACNTSSVTPAIQFNTSENAWCAIAGSLTALDLNYTDMGSSRNCTGDASGEGTKSHLCTITLQDEIIYDEQSFIYISCKDTSNNQNLTSTSGALNVSITDLETTSRNSIKSGIKNSLLSSYATYTDQRVYARNSVNNQSVGRFDVVAKKLNKIWAFNRIGTSDNFVNMFNITPVLYNLEFVNTTQSQITLLTELLINNTK